ncbi:MAG: glycosyltransferase family A protein [Fusicatenibacter sp.]|nr:glycosyltransferase family A protein [Fusicatenibacter sp.]
MPSLVSIVTPCYNGEKYIGRFLDSIIRQSYPKLELVIINDGSTDETERVIYDYQEKLEQRDIQFVYQYQENAGQAAALNRGLKLFTGEYLLWMDSDDEISPDFIEKRVLFLENNPEYIYCYGKAISVLEEEPNKVIQTFEKRKETGNKRFFEDVIYLKNVFFPGYMVKTQALNHVIKNRDIYQGRGGQNAQILLPLAWYYGDPGYVDEAVYVYYIRKNSHSHSQDTSEKIISQLNNYEKILLETLNKIDDTNVQHYIDAIKNHYSRLRYGNAVDTKNPELIKIYYEELKKTGHVSIHEYLLYLKYTKRFFRRFFGITDETDYGNPNRN